MATTCPSCGTDNRPFAKYCIECVAALPATFAPTVFLPRAGVAAAMPAAAARPHAPPHPTTAPMPLRMADEPATRSTKADAAPKAVARKGLWVSVAAFAIALAVGAGGWMIAGAGGWYIYSTAATPATPAAIEPVGAPAVVADIASAPLPMASAASVAAPATTMIPAAPAPQTSAPVPEAAAPSSTSAAAKPVAKAAFGTSTKAPLNESTAPRDSRSRPVAAVSAERSGIPADACAGLNFFAKSRCMAALCNRPAYSTHASCEGVRQQQRLMDEKRNPTMAQ